MLAASSMAICLCSSPQIFFKELTRQGKACMTSGIDSSLSCCHFLFSDTAILQEAFFVEFNLLLLAFVLVLVVTLWHCSTSPIALQYRKKFLS